jgi:hypothetical protein
VQDLALTHTLDDGTGAVDPDQQGHALVEPADHLRVGLIDPGGLRAEQAGQRRHRAGVTTARDPPVHTDDRPALVAQRALEQREPDVDHVNGGRQVDDGSFTHQGPFRGMAAGVEISRPI